MSESKAGEMRVELTVVDRVLLVQMLPVKGAITTMRTARDLTERLGVDGDEMRESGVALVGERLVWPAEKPLARRAFSFGGFALELVLGVLRKANEAGEMTAAHVSLWDAFVPGD